VGSTAELEEGGFGAGGRDDSDDNDARSIRTIVSHGLERVDDGNLDQVARPEQQHEPQPDE
jgi:hypothetical protein